MKNISLDSGDIIKYELVDKGEKENTDVDNDKNPMCSALSVS